ncbi:MAG: sugar phosphate isomerase/epimerase [Xylanivirga thermophila]|uniref:sugar phosphate isomerase/epimerase family protein n=1 Tax=Xylanivirga thermophila TaxID=2496273 RepID=UPI0039F4EBB2
MQIGVSTASFYPAALTEDAVELMGKMGIKNLEVFLETYSEYDENFCMDIAQVLNKYDMRASSVHTLSTQFEPQLFALTSRQRDDAVKIFKKVLKGAKIMGADIYVFHGPPVRANSMPNMDFKRIGRITDELCDMAAEYGVRLAWENVCWCLYAYPEFAIRLLEHTKSNIYFTLDIKQAMKSGYTPYNFLEYMGDRLVNIHLCDYDEEKRLFMPGRGSFDFNQLKRLLDKKGYDGPVIMEIYRNNYKHYSEIMDGVKHLEQIFS